MWCSRCQSAWYCSPEHLHSVCISCRYLARAFLTYRIEQDWSRHRKECIPAVNTSQTGYNVNMIATPPPAEPQYITVSAILFSPEEGQQSVISFTLLLTQRFPS